MGGDISHVLTLAKHWPASTGATIMGFEPGVSPFSRLVEYVEKQIGTKTVSLSKQELSKQDGDEDEHEQAATAGKKGGGGAVSGLLRRTPTSVVRDGSREWIVLRNAPLSDRSRTVKISNQPFAGDNTASLEAHYQAKQSGLSRTVRSLTLDNELRRRGLSQHEILILKVDVEGHEMAVLSGASRAIGEGRVPIILVEYGDKMSPAIWDAMKRFKSAAAAAPTVASMPGPSLFSLMKWGDARGYDSFLLGSSGHKPVLIGLTGALWRDEYEVCRDKDQKFSPNGREWKNFSAWNPAWSAVCWYDVALIHRQPRNPELRTSLLQQTQLPEGHCRKLASGWYPSWIDQPWPTGNLCCAHTVARPQHGEVCHTFRTCEGLPGQGGGGKGSGRGRASESLRSRREGRSLADGGWREEHGWRARLPPRSSVEFLSGDESAYGSAAG